VAEFTDFSTSDSTNGVHAELEGDTISGSTTFTGSQGSYTFTAAAGNNTWTSMVQDINSANIGISAGWNATMAGAGDGGITLTSNDSTDVMYVNPATNTIIDGGVGAALEQVSTLSVGANGSLTGDDVTAGNITLTGSGGTGAQITTNGSTTWGALATSINSQHATTGINAVYSANLNGTGDGGILMFDTAGTTNDSATMTTIGDGVNSASIVNQGVKGTGIESNVDVYDSSAVDSETDKLSGSFTVDGSHGTYTFAGNGTTTSYATLVSDINAANIGVQATWTTGINGSADAGIVLNSTDTSSVLGAEQTSGTMATADTLVEATGGNSVSHFAAVITGNNDSTVSTPSTAVLQLSNAPISDATATLGGAITIAYHGTSQTFIMGSQPTTASEQVGSAIYTNGTSVQSLVNAINSTQTGGVANNLNNGAVHMLATDPGTGTGAIFLQGVAGYNGAITMTAVNPDSGNGISSPLAVTSAMTAGTTTKGVTGVTGVNASDSITTGGAAISTSDTVAGSITVTNGGDNVGLDTAATGGLASVTNVSATGSSSVNDVLKSGTTFDFTTAAGAAFTYTAAANDTWQTLVSDINNSTTVGSGVATGVTAAWSATAGGAGNGGIVLTNNYNGATNVTVNPSTLADQTVGNVLYADTQNAGEAVSAGTASTPQVTGFSAGSGDLVGDDLLANSSATFTVDGKADTFTANSLGTSTWQSMITQINTSNIGTGDPYGVTASFNANAGGTGVAGMILTNNWSGPDTVTVAQGGIALEDTTASNTPITNTHTVAGTGTATVSVLDAGAAAASTDALTGSIAMTVGANEYTFAAGPTSNWNSLVSAINSSAIGVNDNSGVTAKWNANADGTGIGGIVLTGNEAGMNPVSVTSNSLVDQATAVTDTFTVGAGNNSPSTNQFFTEPTTGANYGNSLTGLANLISAQTNLHVSAQANASGLTLTQTIANGGSIATSGNGLTDVTAGTYNKATSTALASENDGLTGSLVFTVAGNTQSVNMSTLTNQTAAGLISYISQHSSTLGVSAAWVPSTSGNPNFGQIQLTSGTQGSTGGVVVSPLTSLTDTTTGAALNYTAGTAYNTGISANVVDSNTSQTSAAQLSSQNLKGSGIATISYTDGAGQSLASTKLTNQTNAEATLNALNTAITDVASQDGYIGAQINTLNAVSSVLSTQQENVVSAQNAVQATDYASATSNMSKYEILSQTGISALAQANSMSQEVTKLLQ
jgi:flagellin